MTELFNGYKSIIGATLGALTGALLYFGLIDVEMAGLGGTVSVAIFGAGIAGKAEKATQAMRDLLDAILTKAPALAGAILIAGALAIAPVAQASDCSFETAVDAEVVRFAWPPALGINALDFVDFEVGYSGGFTVCGNAKANILGGLCLIPGVADVVGPLCSEPTAPPEPE